MNWKPPSITTRIAEYLRKIGHLSDADKLEYFDNIVGAAFRKGYNVRKGDELKMRGEKGHKYHSAEIERLKQVRCEGCGYLVSEREHLGCKSEKTLKDLERLTTERDNAEKREYEVLGRANALEAELKATQARLVASDKLLREEFAQRQDALATLRDIGDFAHDRSTGPAVEDALWEVRRMAYELLTPNAKVNGGGRC